MPKRINREQLNYFVGPDIEAVGQIESGQEVVFETVDCYSGAIRDSSQQYNLTSEILQEVTGLNAVTGPLAIKGAKPGDVLAVQVLDIELGKVEGRAITAIFSDFGGMCNPFSLIQEIGPDTKVCQVKDGAVEFPIKGKTVELPIRPMIGTIWTAPAQERRAAYVYDAHNCGNVDCPDLGPGATLYLPVSVPGGMLSIGDVHACQGDGEITGQALETAADVRLRVDLIKAKDSKIQIVLNGEKTVDMDLNDWDTAGKNPDGSGNKFGIAYKDLPSEGYIALQDHGQAIEYRNVRILELE